MGKQIDHVLLVDNDFNDNYIHKMVISSTGLVKKVALAKDGFRHFEQIWFTLS
ncbi:MAG: hypothetical protein KI786_03160 [Mameliella sp.]|nr:hypothetical protein [Phaeodactylibacter sp.]NRA48689.1 hypothetical protein [Phaeodactylibacter sp.]